MIYVCLLMILFKSYRFFQIFQLSHYKEREYLIYVKQNYLDYNLIFLGILIFQMLFPFPFITAISLILTLLVGLVQFIPSKKRLIFTKRVWRMFLITFVIATLLLFIPSTILKFFVVLGYEFLILSSKYLLVPIERMINKSYTQKMKEKLQGYEGNTIAITGSFGKTSTKKYLQELLKIKYHVAATPKSYNTPLGITKFFNDTSLTGVDHVVLEFGASKTGDIAELVALFHPKVAFVTAVGAMHLDTFHSVEAILEEKMKLVQSLPSGSVAVLNYENELIRSYPIKDEIEVLSYGFDYGMYQAKNCVVTATGSSFQIYKEEEEWLTVDTPVIGRHQILNLLAAISYADYLGLDEVRLKLALSEMKNVENRLSTREVNGTLILDDAYNSNLDGALSALEVLDSCEGSKVVITPGFVENDVVLEEISGTYAERLAVVADTIMLVGGVQSKPIQMKLHELGCSYKVFESFQEAYQAFESIIGKKVLLIENDLPDLYDGGKR